MNRLIIIGNGFDIAHGLNTRYSNFIDWYWDCWWEKLLKSMKPKEEDILCRFILKDNHNFSNFWELWNYYANQFNENTPGKVVIKAIRNDEDLSNYCKFESKSELFETICKSYESNKWVDIENIFYGLLCKKASSIKSPEKTNDDLEFIKKELIYYLKKTQNGITEDITQKEIYDKLFEPIKKRDIAISSMNSWNAMLKQRLKFKQEAWLDLVSAYRNPGRIHDAIYYIERFIEENANRIEGMICNDIPIESIPNEYCLPDMTMLLNFNYTTVADYYFKPNERLIINHIHGKIDTLQSVIFGYGDELDEQYQALVNKKENHYLDNIKSIKYLESPNYRQLLSFIDADAFQIYIMGHSCGNSDRTLLNTLFEHRNCVSIKPFYYMRSKDSDNYMDLVQNISRNFTDMKLMRDRVVNKTFCEPLLVND